MLLVLIIVLRIVFLTGLGLKEKYFPAPPPPATLAFGKLPFPNAQNNTATPSANITYTLETVDGNLPTLPITMKVYFMPKSGPSFGSFDKMKSQAAKIGFNSIPQKTGPTSWHFIDKDNPLRAVDIDEISGNFRLTYNYLSDPSLFSEKNFTSVETAASFAQGFFDSLGVLASDLKAVAPSVSFLRLDAGTLVSTTAISNADAVGVTFNRASLEKFPVVSPDARQGLVSVLFSAANDTKKKVLEARFLYSLIDQENWATYPLIKPADALEKLKAGKGILASLPSPTPTSISIRQVYLAYLDPYPPQSYLQPVLVFSDQKGFVAYVPVVSGEWTE